ncbi:MAG: succinate dehydrogenase cytochrome b subunit [Bacteroidota bacterium]|nr:succinate dehydrogenase cytochrome b subunit [Bacteroidota bacterium]
MSKFLSASIGRKILMSVTGLFLVIFVAVHLCLNILLIFDNSGDLFNMAAHFMATNPLIKVMEPVLALGFFVHIIWSFIVTLQNMKARPISYNVGNKSKTTSWASKNMLILGSLVLVFLVIHLMNFFLKIKFNSASLGEVEVMQAGSLVKMENAYALVSTLFINSSLYCIIYIVGAVLLGLHLTHGFWSAFQTIGLNNKIWKSRLGIIAIAYAIIIAVGYSVIPLYFMLGFSK